MYLGSVLCKSEEIFGRERQLAQRKSPQWYTEYPECSPSGRARCEECRPACATKRLHCLLDASGPS